MKAVELKNVSFTYEGGNDPVLQNCNMYVDYGEVALLSGFSGEGKSTVLSLMSGIIPNITPGVVSGDVLVNGDCVLGKKMSEVCREVGVVLQNADSQIINQIVEDEIAFGCENFGFSKEDIARNIERSCHIMKLEPQWKTRTLSGGQKQRLITASTLATGQRIIVLDEPLANLDKAGSHLLMNALKKLALAGCAVLVVEHRLDMVMPYVDTVWSIKGGKISKVQNRREYLISQSENIHDLSAGTPCDEKVFELSHVSFSVKNRQILKDIDLSVKKGERVLLLGENGCGKTTLMRLLGRLYKPVSGSMVWNITNDLSQKTRADKKWFKNVGVVYQNPNYQLFMPTVFQEVAFGAESVDYAREIMELFGIAPLADRHPHSLSEGQKRRVSIAAVAAAKPKVLLLDEPTVGQDYTGLRDMIDILNKLHDESGNTMITVTHDMRCAEALCDRCFVMENGVIAASGGKSLAHSYFYATDIL